MPSFVCFRWLLRRTPSTLKLSNQVRPSINWVPTQESLYTVFAQSDQRLFENIFKGISIVKLVSEAEQAGLIVTLLETPKRGFLTSLLKLRLLLFHKSFMTVPKSIPLPITVIGALLNFI